MFATSRRAAVSPFTKRPEEEEVEEEEEQEQAEAEQQEEELVAEQEI